MGLVVLGYIAAAGTQIVSKPATLTAAPPDVILPTTATFVVPVGISRTSASASFLMVTSLVLPCPVRIRPSAACVAY